jgi:hypothetical protein
MGEGIATGQGRILGNYFHFLSILTPSTLGKEEERVGELTPFRFGSLTLSFERYIFLFIYFSSLKTRVYRQHFWF